MVAEWTIFTTFAATFKTLFYNLFHAFMKVQYNEYKQLDLTAIGEEIRVFWEKNDIFKKSLDIRRGNDPFVFFEGPPSANGVPGIHHVMSRTIKDLFCRYQTLKGKYVERKGGWDTHGLPVELNVEKNLGITKEDIGVKISVDDYNKACREEVMKHKNLWDELTRKMGYWVDLENPYITFENAYIETLWFLLSEMYKKGLLYKGYTIQPYSPAAGTGLSSHELNMPGSYRDVKDTTCIAMFRLKAIQPKHKKLPFTNVNIDFADVQILAWTTTPWTLPSNTALCVGPNIEYVLVKTFNPYSGVPTHVILAKPLLNNYFPEKNAELPFADYKHGDKDIPFSILGTCKGADLKGLDYEQLIPWVNPGKNAFCVITGDFVTTEDGTGIVHIAPTFGSDDDRVAKQSGIVPLQVIDKEGKRQPLVDRTGKFFRIEDLDPDFVKQSVNVELYKDFAGSYVKNAFDVEKTEKDPSVDVDIAVMLKTENKVFKIEKHTHNYPHCWRTDKPILYYPLDSWFIRTTAVKDRLIELNKTINWKPEATGTGRFGNWLENLVDWNLSRSRYWGTPLPIWRTEDGSEEICIASVAQLSLEIDKAIEVGFMKENPYKSDDYTKFDLHRPYIDNVFLVSSKGEKMTRETDLIDVWFDSGSMPYAQYHYMGEEGFVKNKSIFPADFIAEGVDQTRGWFFTLHAISTMVFDTISFKNVISNGLVLDKNGNKMSKRLGNGVDPFMTIEKYGPDATRWYMITNSQPWDNLKFDESGVDEVRRKFFGTLYNTYTFFALYANIDGFKYAEAEIPFKERAEIDQWILSELHSLIIYVDNALKNYEPTRAGRAIQEFIDEHLSNWYVRLSRRRFWKGIYSTDKISAYQTLYICLETIAQLISPIAPFFAEKLFLDLNQVSGRFAVESVHLTDFPKANQDFIDKALEERMQMAQKIASMVLSLRKKANIRVRQPLAKIMIPVASDEMKKQLQKVENLILSEVNVKEIEYLSDDNNVLVKKIKPNFKTLGPRYGKLMKQIAQTFETLTQDQIRLYEQTEVLNLEIEGQAVEMNLADAEITTQDIPGWAVTTQDNLTVALDMTINETLANEGIAREIVNRVQNMRKDLAFEVTDRIVLTIEKNEQIKTAVETFSDYICSETLAKIVVVDNLNDEKASEQELTETVKVRLTVTKAHN